jgi:S1-C subfamily serine protease
MEKPVTHLMMRMSLLLVLLLTLTGCDLTPPAPSQGPFAAPRVADLARPATVLVESSYTAQVKTRLPQLSDTAVLELILTLHEKIVGDREFEDEQEQEAFLDDHEEEFTRGFLQELAGHFDHYFVPGETDTRTVKFGRRGSGFVASAPGYVITNAHVAAPSDEELANQALSLRRAEVDEQLRDMLDRSTADENGIEFSVVDVSRSLGNSLRTFLLKHSEARVTRREVRVIPSGAATSTGTVANVVAHGKSSPDKDVAIVKTDGTNRYALPLATREPLSGEKVFGVGFPGVAMLEEAMAREAETEPTFQEGSVSGLKSMSGGWKAIQTTISASPGQSGGPVLDSSGHVVGIFAFGIEDPDTGQRAAQLSYVIPVQVVQEFLHQASVTPELGTVTERYRQALACEDRGYFRLARQQLQEIRDLGVEHPDFSRKLTEYGAQVSRGKDRGWEQWIPFLAGGGALLLSAAGSAVWLHRRPTRKRSKVSPRPAGHEQPQGQTQPAALYLLLDGASEPLSLTAGECFTELQLPGVPGKRSDGLLAEVVSDPSQPGRLGLRNHSAIPWQVSNEHDPAFNLVPPDGIVELAPLCRLRFGSRYGVVHG